MKLYMHDENVLILVLKGLKNITVMFKIMMMMMLMMMMVVVIAMIMMLSYQSRH